MRKLETHNNKKNKKDYLIAFRKYECKRLTLFDDEDDSGFKKKFSFIQIYIFK